MSQGESFQSLQGRPDALKTAYQYKKEIDSIESGNRTKSEETDDNFMNHPESAHRVSQRRFPAVEIMGFGRITSTISAFRPTNGLDLTPSAA